MHSPEWRLWWWWLQAEVEAVVAMFTEEATERLLAGNPNFVIDAIDNIDTKVGSAWRCCVYAGP